MSKFDRRIFLSALTVVPLTSLLSGQARSQDLSRLSLGSPTATALDYVEVSGNPVATCANCELYTGEIGEEWGGCTILPGKLVAASGWCKYWVARTG